MESFKWKPVEHEDTDVSNWRWKNYTKLYSLDLPFDKKRMQKRCAEGSDREVREEAVKEEAENN